MKKSWNEEVILLTLIMKIMSVKLIKTDLSMPTGEDVYSHKILCDMVHLIV